MAKKKKNESIQKTPIKPILKFKGMSSNYHNREKIEKKS